jgi:hypothetical protein
MAARKRKKVTQRKIAAPRLRPSFVMKASEEEKRACGF